MKYALITGATSGIGKACAIKLAHNNYSLLLIGRNNDELIKLKETLHTNVEILCIDLTKDNACNIVFNTFKDYPIELIINSAGIGYYGDFLNVPLEKHIEIIELNIKALMKITYLFGNTMKKGKIINVASTAAFSSGAYMSIYYASKAFVLSFSEALNYELKNIEVKCLLPGPTKSNFIKRAGLKESSMKILSSEKVAKKALESHKDLIIPGFTNQLLYIVSKIMPRSINTKIVGKTNERRRYTSTKTNSK